MQEKRTSPLGAFLCPMMRLTEAFRSLAFSEALWIFDVSAQKLSHYMVAFPGKGKGEQVVKCPRLRQLAEYYHMSCVHMNW